MRRDVRASAMKIGSGLDVFNTVVFGGIDTNITSDSFGRVTSQTNAPRVARIKVRVEF